ncbi:hypothetical protein D3C81_1944830 [compost metagenome]
MTHGKSREDDFYQSLVQFFRRNPLQLTLGRLPVRPAADDDGAVVGQMKKLAPTQEVPLLNADTNGLFNSGSDP